MPDSDTEEKHYAFRVRSSPDSNGMLDFNVGCVSLKMLVDSGATTNVVDEATWEQLKLKNIECVSKRSNEV